MLSPHRREFTHEMIAALNKVQIFPCRICRVMRSDTGHAVKVSTAMTTLSPSRKN
jgi:hypothetical protein